MNSKTPKEDRKWKPFGYHQVVFVLINNASSQVFPSSPIRNDPPHSMSFIPCWCIQKALNACLKHSILFKVKLLVNSLISSSFFSPKVLMDYLMYRTVKCGLQSIKDFIVCLEFFSGWLIQFQSNHLHISMKIIQLASINQFDPDVGFKLRAF